MKRMKLILTTAIFLLLVTGGAKAQEIRKIQYIQSGNVVKEFTLSDIDSITFDTEPKRMIVHKNGSVLYNTSLSASDSIRFIVYECETITSEFEATGCGSYIWNGETFTQSGDYPRTFVLPDGCDSTVTLYLTIKEDCIVINGIPWSVYNVGMPGTFVSNPEDAGMFYQWNRNVGWSSTDPLINSEGGTVWNYTLPSGDSWESANDPCPIGWRVPTKDEFESLLNSVSTWGQLNGVNGRFFGNGEERLFLRITGDRGPTIGVLGGYNWSYYWSSTAYDWQAAYYLSFGDNVVHMTYFDRRFGHAVRCVAE